MKVRFKKVDQNGAALTHWPAGEFNTHIENHGKTQSKEFEFELTDDQLEAICALRDELFARWLQAKTGQTMELEFGV